MSSHQQCYPGDGQTRACHVSSPSVAVSCRYIQQPHEATAEPNTFNVYQEGRKLSKHNDDIFGTLFTSLPSHGLLGEQWLSLGYETETYFKYTTRDYSWPTASAKEEAED